MSYQEAYQEPYTKFPNRYSDVIKPRLTDTQRDICDLIVRLTCGWHRENAAISNSVFVRKTNKTKQGIIKAKKQLEEIGILIVLEKGGGSKTSVYMLDFWYDNPDRSIKASIIRQEEQLEEMEDSLSEEQEDIPESLEVPTTEEPQQEIKENPNCDIPEPQAIESGNHTQKEENTEQEISDTKSVETGKLSLPPYKEDLSSILNKKEKHTVTGPQDKKTKSEKKKAIATVRYKFFSIFPEAREEDDWKFFGWVAKKYNLDTCLEKLNYMKEHRKRHTITNPKGFFRTALIKDYQLPAFIQAKIRADENARREIERYQKERKEWTKKIENFDYEAAKASLSKLLATLN